MLNCLGMECLQEVNVIVMRFHSIVVGWNLALARIRFSFSHLVCLSRVGNFHFPSYVPSRTLNSTLPFSSSSNLTPHCFVSRKRAGLQRDGRENVEDFRLPP